jgi:hypothetical protein
VKTCTATLKSAAAYSQSRPHITVKLDKESHDDYERRTWRNKLHVDENGIVNIPGMSLKMALDRAASLLSIKIPGRRNATYTKHFVSGVLVLENAPIGITKDEPQEEWVYVNADGVRGSGKRVWRCFPLIPEWQADVNFYLADETITESVFEQVLAEAGKFVGIGRFRPQNGGFKGRFQVVKTTWS